MNRSYPKILRNRKRRIERRLDARRIWSHQAEPIMQASNVYYEMAEKSQAVNCGGLGVIHLMGAGMWGSGSIRIQIPGGFYHVMARGNRRETIFF